MKSKKISGTSILHIVTRLDRGGSAEIVLELARMLSGDNVSVGIIVGRTVEPQEDLDSFAERTGIPIYTVPELVREVSPLKDITAFFKIRKLIRRFKPDIVHTHTSKAGIIGRFAARVSGVRFIVHTPHGHIFYGYYSSFRTFFFILLERIAAKITSKITVLTEKGLCDHVDKKIGTESLFAVIPSGVDIQRFKEGGSTGVLAETGWKDKKIVGWVGRLVPIKDCLTFIQAAALIRRRCPDVRFIVAGDGEEREMLKRGAREAGLNDFLVFLGDRTDIPSVMAAMDVFVLSSLNEGFGRVLVEAMAAGTVVISSAVGGTVDVIEDGESGILVPPSEPSRIADAVSKVLENSELNAHLIDGGRERAKLFDIHITAEKFEDLYEKLLGL